MLLPRSARGWEQVDHRITCGITAAHMCGLIEIAGTGRLSAQFAMVSSPPRATGTICSTFRSLSEKKAIEK